MRSDKTRKDLHGFAPQIKREMQEYPCSRYPATYDALGTYVGHSEPDSDPDTSSNDTHDSDQHVTAQPSPELNADTT